MIDPAQWKQKRLPVTALQLDHRNPRIPERKTAATQAELIAELVTHDSVYELAKDMSEVGFLPDSTLIVVMEAGKPVVVEGNRRLAALKLLISPTLAPTEFQAKFRRLSEKITIPRIRKVRVEVAPSRDSAALVIQRKHTGSQIEKWSRAMQARFYYERIADGTSVADLAKEFSIPPSEITSFLQSHEMYSIACTLDLPANVAAIVRNPREFPLTNLDRIYRNKKGADFLGINFDENRQIKGKVAPAEFIKGFKKIVTDVANGDADSRKLNEEKDFDKYFKSFGSDTPDLTQKGNFTSTTLTKTAPPKGLNAGKKIPSPPKTNPKPPSKALIPKDFNPDGCDDRIDSIIRELKKLSIEDYPNAVATLLRALVDLTVTQYADTHGISKAIIAEHKAKNNKKDDWYPSSRQLLNRLLADGKSLSLPPLVLKASQKLMADNQQPFTVSILDSYVHNRHVEPSTSELRSFWMQLEEVLAIMLTAPQQSPQATP